MDMMAWTVVGRVEAARGPFPGPRPGTWARLGLGHAACVLLIPIAMLAIGIRYSCHAPKKIQALHGYRSQWSMKNQATWEFAHHYCGRLWKWFGAASLPLSTLAMLPLLGRKADAVGIWSWVPIGAQLLLMVVSIVLTERALRRNFDEYGNPKAGGHNR